MNINANDFLRVADQFRLGTLDTESFHPRTARLSDWAQRDLPEGIRALQEADRLALEKLRHHAPKLAELAAAVRDTLAAGGRLFFCGCGATGRLSLSLELFCREGLLPVKMRDRAIGFMAGGDLALIRSIETFEDFSAYGARQLEELGFAGGDLLIASTEGGETPWVIGAAERAAELSQNRPFFLYCNPDHQLAPIERCARVLGHPGIRKISLPVGPMALSGSTRMQASTVLLAAIVIAIQCREHPACVSAAVEDFARWMGSMDLGWLDGFIRAEEAAITRGCSVLYQPGDFGITVLTDTTERSPTFTLAPFENRREPGEPSALAYLHFPGSPHAEAAWQRLLRRAPRTLEWENGVAALAGRERLLGYDFSDEVLTWRAERAAEGASRGCWQQTFRIDGNSSAFLFQLGCLRHCLRFPARASAWRHLLLKVILNTHSTLLMGRLGRYQNNVMTWVKPANLKLIDRAIRYTRQLLRQRAGEAPDYEIVARRLFEVMETLGPEEPVVLRTAEQTLLPVA